MAVVATITDQINEGSLILVLGTLVFSGNYVTGGEIPTYPGLKTGKGTPARLWMSSVNAAYQPIYDPLTGKIAIFQGDNTNVANSPGIQLAAAAYPAALTGAVTYFQAFFRKP